MRSRLSVPDHAAGPVTLGRLAVVMAFRVAELAAVPPFRYAVILASLDFGPILFDEWPNGCSVLGIAPLPRTASTISALRRRARRSTKAQLAARARR